MGQSWLPSDPKGFDPDYPVTAWGKRSGGKRSSSKTGFVATQKSHNATPRQGSTVGDLRTSRCRTINPTLDELIAKHGVMGAIEARVSGSVLPKKPSRSRFFMRFVREGARLLSEKRAQEESERYVAHDPAVPRVELRIERHFVSYKCNHEEWASAEIPDEVPDEDAELYIRFLAKREKCPTCMKAHNYVPHKYDDNGDRIRDGYVPDIR